MTTRIYELTGQTKRNSGNVVQYSYSYTYDDIGNRLTLTDQGSAVTTSTYNAGGQLHGTDASGTLHHLRLGFALQPMALRDA